VADCAVTVVSHDSYKGEAMSMGERTPIALLDAPASGRMAVAEAITNIAATKIGSLTDVKLSANWMAAAGHKGEDEKLFRTVEAVGMELCPELGITIPVGKDSMSMRTAWTDGDDQKAVTAPLSLVISAFAPVEDVRLTVTPELRTDKGDTELLLVDLGNGKNRIGGSILTQVYNEMGDAPVDLDSAAQLKGFFNAIQASLAANELLAYHDRSDGGLFTAVTEMAFAGHVGVTLDLNETDVISALFTEEAGAVLQVTCANSASVQARLRDVGVKVAVVGSLNTDDQVVVSNKGQTLFARDRAELQQIWTETSFRIQSLRDNPECAQQEFDAITAKDPGLSANL